MALHYLFVIYLHDDEIIRDRLMMHSNHLRFMDHKKGKILMSVTKHFCEWVKNFQFLPIFFPHQSLPS